MRIREIIYPIKMPQYLEWQNPSQFVSIRYHYVNNALASLLQSKMLLI